MDEFYGAFISFLDPASRQPLFYSIIKKKKNFGIL